MPASRWWYLLVCNPLLTVVLVGSLALSRRALRPGSVFVSLDPALVSLQGVAAVLATLCALLTPVALYRDTTAIARTDPAWRPNPRRYAAVGALAVFAPGLLATALSLVGAVPWAAVAVASLVVVSAVDLVSVVYSSVWKSLLTDVGNAPSGVCHQFQTLLYVVRRFRRIG